MKLTQQDKYALVTLKWYVYVYIDPRNNKPFYIGKGKGGRLFSLLHLNDKSESKKVERIAEIRKSDNKPRIDILRYGLSDDQAELVEAAAIDLIGKKNLTNKQDGHHEGNFARITSQDAIIMFKAKKVKVKHKAILITINKLYRSDMTAQELYEATRGVWVVGHRRNDAEFAMAVYQGIVREVYRIKQWYPAGTTEYQTRDVTQLQKRGRWEFKGSIAEKNIRDRYVNKCVGKGGRNPIRYENR